MATVQSKKIDKPEVIRRTKIETTWEYRSIIGGILGYWRKQEVCRMGESIELHLNHSLEAYDRIVVNGEEILYKDEAGKLQITLPNPSK